MKIEILLSTYNGEKYLGQLMDSLLAQTHKDFHITVRDDGSKDNTVNILLGYEREFPEKITFIRDEKNLGYPDCFWYLIKKAQPADMYAYCDQDDVWDEHKLEACCEKCSGLLGLESGENNGTPILYVHDYKISDGDLNVYGEHSFSDEGFAMSNPYKTIFYVMTQGFTMIISEGLRQRMIKDKLYRRDIAHDRWTFWAGMFAADLVYDDRKLAIYRRHESSVTQTGKSSIIMLKEWWHEDVVGSRFRGWCKTARYFAWCYKKEMEPRVYKKWLLFAGKERGVGAYFRRLFDPMPLKPSKAGEAVLRILFFLNKK